MFRIAVILFAAIVSHYLSAWMTLADIPPNDPSHYDNPVTMELSRRLDELVSLRAKDVQRIGDLVTRVTELEDLRAKDLSTMTRKIKDLEEDHTKGNRLDTPVDRHKNVSDTKDVHPVTVDDSVVIDNDSDAIVNGSDVIVNYSDAIDTLPMAKKEVTYSTRHRGYPILRDRRNNSETHTRSSTVGHWNSTNSFKVTDMQSVKGEKGDSGNVGPKGDKGDPGQKGDIGPRGPVGPVGPEGKLGETGGSGDPGIKGDVGPVGPIGHTGPTGHNGATGSPGALPTPIAFHAEMPHSMSVHKGVTVVYNHEVLDLGHGYSTHSGVYVVPASGTYVLTWTTLCHANDYIQTHLIVNGAIRGYSFTNSDEVNDRHQSTAVVVLSLHHGDHVYIRVDKTKLSGSIASSSGSARSTFSGWKLV